MAPYDDLPLNLLLHGMLSVAACAVIMVVHGVLVHCRLGSSQSLAEWLPTKVVMVGVASVGFTLLLLNKAKVVPLEWLGTLTLLVATAPFLLLWLGPPEQHVQFSNVCQIGRGSAYSHYYGYLMLMQGDNGVRKRLKKFKLDNPSGLSAKKQDNPSGLFAEKQVDFYSDAVVVLAPTNGEYPSDALSELLDDELRGVSGAIGEVPNFRSNQRSYGKFSVHTVTGSNGSKLNVALDKVGALATLRKLKEHDPAGLSKSDCEKQMLDMLDQLKKIVVDSSHLRGQLKVVRYSPEEHVGDAIMTQIGE